VEHRAFTPDEPQSHDREAQARGAGEPLSAEQPTAAGRIGPVKVPSIHGIGKWVLLSLVMTLLVVVSLPTAPVFAVLGIYFATRAYRYDPSIGMALGAATLIATVYAFRIATILR
jgi:hypothetical protein